MSWFCSVCEKCFGRKDNMKRHVMSKHRTAGLTPFQTVPMFSPKCQWFCLEHPFTIKQKSNADFTVGNILSFDQYFGRHGLPSSGSYK